MSLMVGARFSRDREAVAWHALVDHIQDFQRITADWPEFSEQGFPQQSIEHAIAFFTEVWNRTDSQGRSTLADAFCGPSEDGAVNCQWKRDNRFLGISFSADGLINAYFHDSATGEEHEGPTDAATVARWLEGR
jgi:hypothetical protein